MDDAGASNRTLWLMEKNYWNIFAVTDRPRCIDFAFSTKASGHQPKTPEREHRGSTLRLDFDRHISRPTFAGSTHVDRSDISPSVRSHGMENHDSVQRIRNQRNVDASNPIAHPLSSHSSLSFPESHESSQRADVPTLNLHGHGYATIPYLL